MDGRNPRHCEAYHTLLRNPVGWGFCGVSGSGMRVLGLRIAHTCLLLEILEKRPNAGLTPEQGDYTL